MSAVIGPVVLEDVVPLPPPETPWQRLRREFFANKLAVAGLVSVSYTHLTLPTIYSV